MMSQKVGKISNALHSVVISRPVSSTPGQKRKKGDAGSSLPVLIFTASKSGVIQPAKSKKAVRGMACPGRTTDRVSVIGHENKNSFPFALSFFQPLH